MIWENGSRPWSFELLRGTSMLRKATILGFETLDSKLCALSWKLGEVAVNSGQKETECVVETWFANASWTHVRELLFLSFV